jgi:hypothetical protein
MRSSTAVKSVALLMAAIVASSSAAHACSHCFASSAPGVLHAYLVSVFSMIALAWGAIGAITLYALHVNPEKARAEK